MTRTQRLISTAASVALLYAASAAAVQPPPPPLSVTLDRADQALRTAELAADSDYKLAAYERAESLAAEVLAADPDSAHANFLLFAARGRRLLATRGRSGLVFQFSKLNGYLERAIELDPGHHRALAVRGGILLDLPRFLGGSVEKARLDLMKALDLNPSGAGTRLTLAKALIEQGKDDEARRHALLGAHYACTTRRAHILREATAILAKLGPGDAAAGPRVEGATP